MANDTDMVLGIDLGTTFSAMAYVNRYGKPEIIPNADGQRTTPSVVHFYDEDACVVGDEAVKMVVIDPANVIRFIKRHMGEEDFTLEFFGQNYTPQEVSALILTKLKQDAEELVGYEIHDAVITVPAYFNSAQRGATAEAGKIAGLNVLSIINEPTAAAIAHGLDRVGEDRKLLVLDLGGGTFDVTAMEIRGSKLVTVASDGNAELGGKDWDDRLVNYVADEFFEKFSLDPRDEAAPYQELYERCLHAKISLSSKDRAVIPVNYKGHRTVVKVTRELFEELTEDLVQQCEDTAALVIEKAGFSWEEIDDLLLVGGSTRMPMIQRALTNLTGKQPVESINPDEAVALGAALAGVFRHRPDHPSLKPPEPPKPRKRVESLPPEPSPSTPRGAVIGMAYGGHVAEAAVERSRLQAVEIQDATTHPLGIIVLDRERQERVVELIPEGTPVPHQVKGRFAYAYQNMTAVRVEVTEGSGAYRDEVTVIGKVELNGLPPRPRGTPIEVVYAYGVDQILEVAVIDVETGATRKVSLRFKGGMNHNDLSDASDRRGRMHVE
ncbi:MAG: Hsp70 family protein [Deltaproteobacteria bacterium]|nr:Hsp70 family protein [Deltaproteobacteria bacterium]